MVITAAHKAAPPSQSTLKVTRVKEEEPDRDEPLDGVRISLNGETVATIEQDGPTFSQRLLRSTGDVLTATARGVISVSAADPSFAFSQTARAVKPIVLQDMPSGIEAEVDKVFTPMLRGVNILMDAKKWLDRRRKTELAVQNGTYDMFDQVGTIMDGAHLVTDVAGIVGAVGAMASPGSGIFSGLLSLSFVSDIAVYSFHALEYIHEIGQDEPPPTPPPTNP